VGKPLRGKRLTWKTRRRLVGVHEVKQEIRWDGEDWIYLPQEKQVAGCCEHGNEHSGTVNARSVLPSYRTAPCS